MPYRCVHCSKLYDDGSKQVLMGCDNCHSRFFFYIREEQLKKIMQNQEIELTESEKKTIEKDIRDIIGIEDEKEPIFLDFESIKIIKPGKYVVDIGNLFSIDKPRVYKLEDGKYIIDFVSPKVSTKTSK